MLTLSLTVAPATIDSFARLPHQRSATTCLGVRHPGTHRAPAGTWETSTFGRQPPRNAPCRALAQRTSKVELPVAATALNSPWRQGLVNVGHAQVEPVQVPMQGHVPPDIDVTLFRNGPGNFDGVQHWFDAPGYLTKMHIAHGKVSFQGNFVETLEMKKEAKAKKPIYGGFGRPLPHGLWTAMRSRVYKNVANTAVLYHGHRLYALGEGGAPERIDPTTLESLGSERFDVLRPQDAVSAHPKIDPRTGLAWVPGINYELDGGKLGLCGRLRLFRVEPNGRMTTVFNEKLPFPGFMHDFCLTETRAILVIPPFAFKERPVDWLLGKTSLDQVLTWRPELGTQVIAVDLKTGAWTHTVTDPMVVQHTVNAWDEGDDVVFDLCDAEDPAAWRMWRDIMRDDVHPRRLARVKRFRLHEGRVLPQYHPPIEMEFPTVSQEVLGTRHTEVFGVTWNDREAFFGVPTRIDVRTGATDRAPLAPGEYAGEGILVPKGRGKRGHWLISNVTCTQGQPRKKAPVRVGHTEIRIYDADRLQAGAVAKGILPQNVPYGFHGTYVPNRALEP